MNHKDTTIGSHSYRLDRMSATDGTWVYTTFIKRYREYVLSRPQQPQAPASSGSEEETTDTTMPSREQGSEMSAAFLVENLSRSELRELQDLCLGICRRYVDVDGTPKALPIMHGDGRFAQADLAQDGPTVLELTKQSIAFNIAPFFPDPASTATKTAGDS